MMSEEQPDRLRIFYIPEKYLLQLVSRRIAPDCIVIPDVAGIPEDAEVIRAHHDYQRRAIAVVVAHGSFDPVEPCGVIPDGESISVVNRVIQLSDEQKKVFENEPTQSA